MSINLFFLHLVAHSLPETAPRCEFYQFALVLTMVEIKLQIYLLLAWKDCSGMKPMV